MDDSHSSQGDRRSYLTAATCTAPSLESVSIASSFLTVSIGPFSPPICIMQLMGSDYRSITDPRYRRFAAGGDTSARCRKLESIAHLDPQHDPHHLQSLSLSPPRAAQASPASLRFEMLVKGGKEKRDLGNGMALITFLCTTIMKISTRLS